MESESEMYGHTDDEDEMMQLMEYNEPRFFNPYELDPRVTDDDSVPVERDSDEESAEDDDDEEDSSDEVPDQAAAVPVGNWYVVSSKTQ